MDNEDLWQYPKGDMVKQQHKHLGKITFNVDGINEKGHGTGILISPNLVLTDAHVAYCKERQKPSCNMKFYHGLHGELNDHNGIAI